MVGLYICPSCKTEKKLDMVNGIPFPDNEIEYELCYTCDRLAGESQNK